MTVHLRFDAGLELLIEGLELEKPLPRVDGIMLMKV